MKARIFGLVCCFLSAILQFVAFLRHHDALYLFVSFGFVILGVVGIYKICKEDETDDIEE